MRLRSYTLVFVAIALVLAVAGAPALVSGPILGLIAVIAASSPGGRRWIRTHRRLAAAVGLFLVAREGWLGDWPARWLNLGFKFSLNLDSTAIDDAVYHAFTDRPELAMGCEVSVSDPGSDVGEAFATSLPGCIAAPAAPVQLRILLEADDAFCYQPLAKYVDWRYRAKIVFTPPAPKGYLDMIGRVDGFRPLEDWQNLEVDYSTGRNYADYRHMLALNGRIQRRVFGPTSCWGINQELGAKAAAQAWTHASQIRARAAVDRFKGTEVEAAAEAAAAEAFKDVPGMTPPR